MTLVTTMTRGVHCFIAYPDFLDLPTASISSMYRIQGAFFLDCLKRSLTLADPTPGVNKDMEVSTSTSTHVPVHLQCTCTCISFGETAPKAL